jgi:hypothetical protein
MCASHVRISPAMARGNATNSERLKPLCARLCSRTGALKRGPLGRATCPSRLGPAPAAFCPYAATRLQRSPSAPSGCRRRAFSACPEQILLLCVSLRSTLQHPACAGLRGYAAPVAFAPGKRCYAASAAFGLDPSPSAQDSPARGYAPRNGVPRWGADGRLPAPSLLRLPPPSPFHFVETAQGRRQDVRLRLTLPCPTLARQRQRRPYGLLPCLAGWLPPPPLPPTPLRGWRLHSAPLRSIFGPMSRFARQRGPHPHYGSLRCARGLRISASFAGPKVRRLRLPLRSAPYVRSSRLVALRAPLGAPPLSGYSAARYAVFASAGFAAWRKTAPLAPEFRHLPPYTYAGTIRCIGENTCCSKHSLGSCS